jgi:hypothetical protein
MAAVSEGAETQISALIGRVVERGADRARTLAGTVLTPWGGAEACIDAYEEGIRAATELQLSIARTLDVEPARSLAAGYADLTRDVVATQVSSARWLFDV